MNNQRIKGENGVIIEIIQEVDQEVIMVDIIIEDIIIEIIYLLKSQIKNVIFYLLIFNINYSK